MSDKCTICKRKLTGKRSLAIGMGPTCAYREKRQGHLFKAEELAQGEKPMEEEQTFKPAVDPQAMYVKVAERPDGAAYMNNGLLVIRGGEIHEGKRWIHVSVSRKKRLPTYEELARIKRDFIGDDKKAIMVLPEAEHHVNIHPYCLHLFHCEDGDGLPEFSRNGMI